MIRFWNDKKLATELADEEVSDKQKLVYFLLTNAATIIGMNQYFSETESASIIDWLATATCVVFTTIGYIICFKSNADGKDFFARCVCLGVPIIIKSLVGFFALVFVLAVTSTFILGDEKTTMLGDSEWLWLVLGSSLSAYFVGRLNYCIKIIQKRKTIGPSISPIEV